MSRDSQDRRNSAGRFQEFDYGDGDIPEIDTTHFQSNATDVIPDEVPRRDGPGGN